MFEGVCGESGDLLAILPAECIRDCSASGPVDDSVAYWVDRIEWRGSNAQIRAFLEGYGAWDESDLADADENLERALWVLACNLREEGAA